MSKSILYSQKVVAICGDSSFVQYGQLKCNWNSVFALMDKVNCKRFFCVRLDTYKVFSLLDIGRMFCIASWKGCNKSELVLDRLLQPWHIVVLEKAALFKHRECISCKSMRCSLNMFCPCELELYVSKHSSDRCVIVVGLKYWSWNVLK